MARTDTPTVESLLAHSSWIRDLARQMARDSHAADDLAQDALVVAMERPPTSWGSPPTVRRWLASVMRNLVRQGVRRDGRRQGREALNARPEGLEATAQLVERVSVQRELAQAVLELDEPQRTAILLRFYEELPPREIARRLGIPSTTVQGRITRGIQQLRSRLDQSSDNARAWLAILVAPLSPPAPMAGAHAPVLLTSLGRLGGIALNAKFILTISLVAIGAVAVVAWEPGGGEPAHPSAVAALERAGAGGVPEEPSNPRRADDPATDATRRPVTSAVAPAQVPSPAAAPEIFTLRGRVLNTDGQPLVGVDVLLEEDATAESRSGLGGWFELQTAETRGSVVAADSELITVFGGSWKLQSSLEPVCVVAPAVHLAGMVSEQSGAPLSGARVRYELPTAFRTRFEDNLESSRTAHGWSAFSDVDGRFELPRIPAITGARVGCVLDGYSCASIDAPEHSDSEFAIVLVRPAIALEGSLKGSVLDHEGRPAARARVAIGLTSTATDENGLFELDLTRAATDDQIMAIKAKHRPAVEDKPPSGWPEFVELVLGGPPLEIAGRVIDHEGKPVSGLRMWIDDPSPFGMVGRMPMYAENAMAGAPVPPMATESVSFLPREDGDDYWDYTTKPGQPSAFWNWVESDGNGRFIMPGLEERHYRLRMMHDETLVAHSTEPIRAGRHDVTVQLPEPELYRHLQGSVVTAAGVPIEGVRVSLSRTAFERRSRVFGGTTYIGLVQPRESVMSDADGRFELENVPKVGLQLGVSSDRIVPTSYELTGEEDPTHLVITVEARCHVDVRLAPPSRAARIGFVDRDGDRLDVIVIRDGAFNAYTSVPLVDGRSGVVSVSSTAGELHLLGTDEEIIERVPITLVLGEVTVLQP